MTKREQAKLEKQQKKEQEKRLYIYQDEVLEFYEKFTYRESLPKDAFYELTYRTYMDGGSNDSDEIHSVLLTEKEVQEWLDNNYLHWQGIQLDEGGKAIRINDDVYYGGMHEEICIRDTRIEQPTFDTSPFIVQLCKEVVDAERAAIETEKKRKKEERAAKKADNEKKEYKRLRAKFEEANEQA